MIEVRGVCHAFGEGEARKPVLTDNELEIGEGELVMMTGPSGSGKTTLLTLIGGLRSLQQGSLVVMGRELAGLSGAELVEHRKRVGYIFQAHNLFPPLSAVENVEMALDLHSVPKGEKRARATALLEELGLGQRLHHRPKMLSGGQKQRVAIARAMVAGPRLVLADEPTAALDKHASHDVLELFERRVREEGATILVVTHDPRVLEVADRIVNMVDGKIASDVRVESCEQIAGFLQRTRLFHQDSPARLTEIASKMKPARYPAGALVFRQGDAGDTFYMIHGGAADVEVDSRVVARLGPGECFGEVALLRNEPRNATIRAVGDLAVYALPKPAFDEAIARSGSFKQLLLSVVFSRT